MSLVPEYWNEERKIVYNKAECPYQLKITGLTTSLPLWGKPLRYNGNSDKSEGPLIVPYRASSMYFVATPVNLLEPDAKILEEMYKQRVLTDPVAVKTHSTVYKIRSDGPYNGAPIPQWPWYRTLRLPKTQGTNMVIIQTRANGSTRETKKIVTTVPVTLEVVESLNGTTLAEGFPTKQNFIVGKPQGLFWVPVNTDDAIAYVPDTMKKYVRAFHETKSFPIIHPDEATAVPSSLRHWMWNDNDYHMAFDVCVRADLGHVVTIRSITGKYKDCWVVGMRSVSSVSTSAWVGWQVGLEPTKDDSRSVLDFIVKHKASLSAEEVNKAFVSLSIRGYSEVMRHHPAEKWGKAKLQSHTNASVPSYGVDVRPPEPRLGKWVLVPLASSIPFRFNFGAAGNTLATG
jgi:hypothetical protein